MLSPFFVLAAVSPSRQCSLRQAVAGHLVLVGAAILALVRMPAPAGLVTYGNLLLVAGIIEGATMVGWRLTQVPRSQSLEFLLVSPLQPGRVFLGEALVGLGLLGLVTLAGLPVLLLLVVTGHVGPFDVLALMVMPWTWGAVTGVGLAAWAYEPRRFRRVGEAVMAGLVVLYLVVGVLAGDKLRLWLEELPEGAKVASLRGFSMLHTHNPFGVIRFWLENDLVTGWRRAAGLQAVGGCLLILLMWRASRRLQGHFHERHYEPARDVSGERRPPVGDEPLSWWAVRRVSEYSGRINLWLAGGFSLLYGGYLVAGGSWPPWMGRRIFEMCDGAGGPAMLAAVLALLAAVPAAFQYGLWDSSVPDRCRRLELLLLTELGPLDYWRAAARAAWARGRGYFAIALGIWLAGWAAGRLDAARALAAVAGAVVLWGLYFTLGFRAFARGAQANGLGLILTVALPVSAVGLAQIGWPGAAWLPPGMVYYAAAAPASWAWLAGAVGIGGVTLLLSRVSLATCDASLRRWYDENAGSNVRG